MSVLQGRFFVGAEIGSGAYGVVCRGVDLKSETRRPVAVKTVDLELLPPDRREFAATTLETELRIMQTLDHPNVLRAITVVAMDERRHIVLELCCGPSVQQLLDARGAFEPDEARDLVQQCLEALRHLHGRGIIHRDIKPGNVMLVDALTSEKAPRAAQRQALRTASLGGKQVKLIDFGLARILPHANKAARRDGSTKEGSKHGGTEIQLAKAAGNSGAWIKSPDVPRRSGGSRHGSRQFSTTMVGLRGLNDDESSIRLSDGPAPEAASADAPPEPAPAGNNTPLSPASERRRPSKTSGLLSLGQSASPGNSEHGSSKGSSVHGVKTPEIQRRSVGLVTLKVGGSKHGGSKHGGSKHGGSKHGGSKHGGSRHGIEDSIYNYDWLSHLEERFEVSAHGSQAFAPPEMQQTWRDHFAASGERPAAANGSMGNMTNMTTRDAWMLDVFAVGMMLHYMLTGIEPTADGLPAPPIVDDFDGGCFGCFSKPLPPFERVVREQSELSVDANDLITRMTAKEAKNRLDIQQCLRHRWIGYNGADSSLKTIRAARNSKDEEEAKEAFESKQHEETASPVAVAVK